MRSLATHLGISSMTAYNYFASKAELREAITEHALEALVLQPDPTESWDKQLEAAMHGMSAALRRHPGILELMIDRSSPVFGHLRRDQITLLETAGLTRSAATEALRTLASYVVGYVLISRARRPAGDTERHESFDRGLGMILSQIRAEAVTT